MSYGISFASLSFILLDIALVLGCWAVDKHLKFLAREEKLRETNYATHLRCLPLLHVGAADEMQVVKGEGVC